MFSGSTKTKMPSAAEALPGRSERMPVPAVHDLLGTPLVPPFPAGSALAMFGMGCFWGAEKKFWQLPGVISTMVGYAAGLTPNPTYKEVCSGRTGHNEVVRVVFDPARTSYTALLKVFWDSHDPTQGMRQGNDAGTQYRSGIYYSTPEQQQVARDMISELNDQKLFGKPVVTELLPLSNYSAAEEYHQDFFEKNPNQGYCMAVAGPKVAKFRKTFSEYAKG